MSPGSLMMSGIRIFALLPVDYNSVLISTQEMHDKKLSAPMQSVLRRRIKEERKHKERNEILWLIICETLKNITKCLNFFVTL